MITKEHPRLAWWRTASAASEQAGGPAMPLGAAVAALDEGTAPEVAGAAYAAQQRALAAASAGTGA